jgi:uncharacterized repeat protein (TIGR03803 family)
LAEGPLGGFLVKELKATYVFAFGVVLLVALCTAIPASAQTFSVLHSFGSQNGDSVNPSANLAQGQDGALYGTSNSGGAHGMGTVFKVSPKGKVFVIYSFCSKAKCADGASPNGGLMLRPNGHFLGTAQAGGSHGFGTVFDVSQTGTYTVLYNFTGGKDGAYPAAPPIPGPNAGFYGTTWQGGAASNCGTIYRMTLSPTTAVFTLLHDFDNAHGCQPAAALTLGTDGNLYGPTIYGGTAGNGVIFKANTEGRVTVLHNFEGTSDGYNPVGPLVEGSDGNIYGTTRGIGAPVGGTVFKMTPSGRLTTLHTMTGPDGAWLIGGLVQASDGNFYGVAEQGGSDDTDCGENGCGSLFQITPEGAFSVLYNFDGTTGYFAQATPLQHTNGMLYGDAYWGGITSGSCAPFGCGVFYSWDANLPAFVFLVPSRGKAGNVVEILGQGFNASTKVHFNGKIAKAVVVSGTYLWATVPSGAATDFVTVTTSEGTLTSNQKFLVVP